MQLEKEILSFGDPNLNKLDSFTAEIIPRAWWQLVFGEKFSFCSCCADHQAILPQVDRALKIPLKVRLLTLEEIQSLHLMFLQHV